MNFCGLQVMAENDNAALSAEADEMLQADRPDLGRLPESDLRLSRYLATKSIGSCSRVQPCGKLSASNLFPARVLRQAARTPSKVLRAIRSKRKD